MKPVFADTSYFVAFCGRNDAFHQRAAALSANLLGERLGGMRCSTP
jgi:hypothetical protein